MEAPTTTFNSPSRFLHSFYIPYPVTKMPTIAPRDGQKRSLKVCYTDQMLKLSSLRARKQSYGWQKTSRGTLPRP